MSELLLILLAASGALIIHSIALGVDKFLKYRMVEKSKAERLSEKEFKAEIFRRLQGLESANTNFNGAIHLLQKDVEEMKGDGK